MRFEFVLKMELLAVDGAAVSTPTATHDGVGRGVESAVRHQQPTAPKEIRALASLSFRCATSYVNEVRRIFSMTGALAGGEPGAQMVLDIGEVIVKVEAVHCASGSDQPICNETNAKCYADRYPDLKAAFGYNTVQLIKHFQEHGYREGRIFNCNTGFSEEPRLEAIRFFLSSGRTSRWFGQPLPQGLLAVQVFEGSKQNPIVGLRRAVGRTVTSSFAEVTFTFTDGTYQVPRRSPCLSHPRALFGCADCRAVRAGRTLDPRSWSSSR